jgi:aminoglycoside phosphotransferase (APT) family kinase protein
VLGDGGAVAAALYAAGCEDRLADVGSAGRTRVFVDDSHALKVFLTAGRKPDREVAGLLAARAAAVRVPEVLWRGVVGHRPAVLLERIHGTQPEPATAAEWLALHRATGELVARLHQPVPGFGPWSVAPVETASELVLGRLGETFESAEREPIVEHALLEGCRAAVLAEAADLGRTAPGLVHRDLSSRNVFGVFTGGRLEITALFDFESCGGGQLEEELRWTSLCELGGLHPAGSTRAVLDGLGHVEVEEHRLRCYVLELALDVFSYAGRRNPPLARAAEHAATRVLDGEPALPG